MAKGLTQVTMGAPPTFYYGGLLRATVRYFDPIKKRPGLPSGVSALVFKLAPERVGIHLCNTDWSEGKKVIVQAGAFGEHRFIEAVYNTMEDEKETEKTIPIENTYLSVDLPPGTSIRLDLGLKRFVNDPSYRFPWHNAGSPVPSPQL